MRISSCILTGFVALSLAFASGCSTQRVATKDDAGQPSANNDGPALCTEDSAAYDVTQVKFGKPTPVVASTLDSQGIAAIWLDGAAAIRFGRFGIDGSVLAGALLVPNANLSGGSDGLHGLSITSLVDDANGEPSYVVAYQDTSTNSVLYRVVDGSGQGGQAKVLNAATRTVGTKSGRVTASAPVVRRSGGGFIAKWSEQVALGSTSSTLAVVQLFDKTGAPTTQPAVDSTSLSQNAGEVDGALVGDRFALLNYRPGPVGVAHEVPVLAQAAATSDLSTWNQSEIKLPPLTGNVSRFNPSIFPADGGTVMVDLASADNAQRIEVAWLDDLGVVKKTSSVDIPATEAVYVADTVARLSTDGTLYVGWVSAKDTGGTESPSIHVVSIGADGAQLRADADLNFPNASTALLDSNTGTIQELVVGSDGAVRVNYVWTSITGTSNVRTRHVAVQTLCLASRKTP